MTNYLGRHSGLAGVIRAVVDGSLAPVGYTNRFPGITGYLFLSENLRKYRPVRDVKMLPEGFLNYREAAAVPMHRNPANPARTGRFQRRLRAETAGERGVGWGGVSFSNARLIFITSSRKKKKKPLGKFCSGPLT